MATDIGVLTDEALMDAYKLAKANRKRSLARTYKAELVRRYPITPDMYGLPNRTSVTHVEATPTGALGLWNTYIETVQRGGWYVTKQGGCLVDCRGPFDTEAAAQAEADEWSGNFITVVKLDWAAGGNDRHGKVTGRRHHVTAQVIDPSGPGGGFSHLVFFGTRANIEALVNEYDSDLLHLIETVPVTRS